MRLAASQIGWEPQQEAEALDVLRACGFAALEIAPPRVAGPQPYDAPARAAEFAAWLRDGWQMDICSMQSIWYGQQGSMFGPERAALADYTGKAFVFAAAAGAPNLVFGCPKNRILPGGMSDTAGDLFFAKLADEAATRGCVLAMEANPTMYGTNYINTTPQAIALVRRVAKPGFGLNLDVGTMVANGEEVAMLDGHAGLISHVHISEPGLAAIEWRPLHRELAVFLRDVGYQGCVSIEMKAQSLAALQAAAEYVAEVFG